MKRRFVIFVAGKWTGGSFTEEEAKVAVKSIPGGEIRPKGAPLNKAPAPASVPSGRK